jgi:GDPmannose 4,6-dehydratase
MESYAGQAIYGGRESITCARTRSSLIAVFFSTMAILLMGRRCVGSSQLCNQMSFTTLPARVTLALVLKFQSPLVKKWRLLEIARDQPNRVKFYHASSSEIFGNTEESPQTEATAFSPASPYGCAKACATQLGRVYRDSYGMFVCNGISYNHESPRRGENFVTRKIARTVARIARGLEDELALGNLEGRRDWGHARDYVQAMWLMLQHEKPDDYLVATGESHSIRDFVTAAFDLVGLPWKKYVTHNRALDRPADPSHLVGCPDKIKRVLHWQPTRSFHDLVREMVETELSAIDDLPKS